MQVQQIKHSKEVEEKIRISQKRQVIDEKREKVQIFDSFNHNLIISQYPAKGA